MSLTIRVLTILSNIQTLYSSAQIEQAQQLLSALHRLIIRSCQRLFTTQECIEVSNIVEQAVQAYNNGTFGQLDFGANRQVTWSRTNPLDALGALSRSLVVQLN